MNDLQRTLLVVLLLAAGCERSGDPAEARSARAKKASGDVVVGLVWPLDPPPLSAGGAGTHFWHGVETAEKQIESKGGVLGRKLKLVRANEDAALPNGKRTAQELARDPDLVAVIGYFDPTVATVVSVTYEFEGVVMMVAGASSERLTRDGFRHVFSMLPSDTDVGERLADEAQERGFNQLLVIYQNDAYGTTVANAFESRAERNGLSVVDRVALDRGAARVFEQNVRLARREGIKAILLAAKLPDAAVALQILKKEGLDAPILGEAGLASAGLAEAEGAIVATTFDPKSEDADVASFVALYRAQHGHDPDASSAQAYDALLLLASAMTQAGTTDPRAVSEALRAQSDFKGVTGQIRFSARGEAKNRKIFLEKISSKTQKTP